MARIRVKVDLSAFYEDHRRLVVSYVCPEAGETIGDLEKRLELHFKLSENFHLLWESYYLSPSLPVELLDVDSCLTAVRGEESSQSSSLDSRYMFVNKRKINPAELDPELLEDEDGSVEFELAEENVKNKKSKHSATDKITRDCQEGRVTSKTGEREADKAAGGLQGNEKRASSTSENDEFTIAESSAPRPRDSLVINRKRQRRRRRKKPLFIVSAINEMDDEHQQGDCSRPAPQPSHLRFSCENDSVNEEGEEEQAQSSLQDLYEVSENVNSSPVVGLDLNNSESPNYQDDFDILKTLGSGVPPTFNRSSAEEDGAREAEIQKFCCSKPSLFIPVLGGILAYRVVELQQSAPALSAWRFGVVLEYAASSDEVEILPLEPRPSDRSVPLTVEDFIPASSIKKKHAWKELLFCYDLGMYPHRL